MNIDDLAEPAGEMTVRRRPSPRTVLAIASLGGVIAFVDATVVNIAFPDITRSFPGASVSALSWVLNAYNVVFAAFLMAGAAMADSLGRRRVFVVGLELFTVGSLLCAIAPSAGALIAFRVVQALGAALLVPSALALVLQAFQPARRSHAVALLSAVSAAAAGLGPSLGGLLVTAADWRLVFLVNVPIGVAAVLARRRLAESRAPGRRRIPDLPGTLLFACAIGALVLGIVQGQQWGWGSAPILGCLAGALTCGAVVVWRCTWHRSPVIDLSLLKIRTVSVANAMTVIGAAGFYGYTLSNVLFLTGLWRYSVLQAWRSPSARSSRCWWPGLRAGWPSASAPAPFSWREAWYGAGRCCGSSSGPGLPPTSLASGCRAWCCSESARARCSRPSAAPRSARRRAGVLRRPPG